MTRELFDVRLLPADGGPEDRRRLVAVAHRLTTHWGQRVHVEAEDLIRLRLFLAGHGGGMESG
ncbi:hypothetical protein ABZ990_12220 [Streptomyces sp. NPDC046203]|uniref:hypothetical protein n=1 Tax=Streptomyces sp. NPDC046203 TaxID=3154602 RepID=UPI0033FB1048